MDAVQMFKTSDGNLFASAEEAQAHEAKIAGKADRDAFVAALKAAGYSPELAGMYARGADIYTSWKASSTVATARKRTKKVQA